jgi:hypothetical protein
VRKACDVIKQGWLIQIFTDAMPARTKVSFGNELLPALEGFEERIKDTEASAKLGVARHQSPLFRVAQEKH